MSTRQFLLDVAQCLRAAATPLLTLGVITLARKAHTANSSLLGADALLGVAWRAVVIASLVWLLVAMCWAVIRPRRDRRAFQRLQHLREMATATDRVLVHVQTTVWSSSAGQHVVVVNVATGTTSRVWLPETTVPIGAFVVLERTDRGVSVVGSMNVSQVEAAHCHERRHAVCRITSGSVGGDPPEHDERDEARQLIEEAEWYLKQQQ